MLISQNRNRSFQKKQRKIKRKSVRLWQTIKFWMYVWNGSMAVNQVKRDLQPCHWKALLPRSSWNRGCGHYLPRGFWQRLVSHRLRQWTRFVLLFLFKQTQSGEKWNRFHLQNKNSHAPCAMADPELWDSSKHSDGNMLLACERLCGGCHSASSQSPWGAPFLGWHFISVQTPSSLEEHKKWVYDKWK